MNDVVRGDPVYGQCDRCGIDIPKTRDVMVLTATNYKLDLKTYRLRYVLCEKCRNEFDKWIFVKKVDTS